MNLSKTSELLVRLIAKHGEGYYGLVCFNKNEGEGYLTELSQTLGIPLNRVQLRVYQKENISIQAFTVDRLNEMAGLKFNEVVISEVADAVIRPHDRTYIVTRVKSK